MKLPKTTKGYSLAAQYTLILLREIEQEQAQAKREDTND